MSNLETAALQHAMLSRTTELEAALSERDKRIAELEVSLRNLASLTAHPLGERDYDGNKAARLARAALRSLGHVCSRCGKEYLRGSLCPGSNHTLPCREPGDEGGPRG
jgi:hypothetical protein